ncbi:MFS transporter [Streptosporangium subroseum]|uniref:MFS transporter n=1 Tax=Streptosporangium subroseum TaxID=106412 RepID=UPI003093A295|nr:MFS transporter [Streptosporangium subroseum]
MPVHADQTPGMSHRRPRFGPRYRWVILGVGVAAQASFSAMFSGIPVTAITMRADYGLSTGELGLVLGCTALGVAASDIVWGLLTDRFGDRRILLTGLISTGALLVLMGLAVVPTGDGPPPTPLLAVGLLLAGVLGGSVNGSSGRAVMTWFREGQRGLAMSIRQTAIPAGGAVGVALMPWLAASHGFRAVYTVLAAFCLVTAVATWRWLHEPGDATPAEGGTAGGKAVSEGATGGGTAGGKAAGGGTAGGGTAGGKAAGGGRAGGGTAGEPVRERSPLRRWDIWRLALASALLSVPQMAILTFAVVFLHDAQHAGAFAGSLVVLVAQLGGAAARVWSGRYTDRHGNRRGYFRVTGALSGVAIACAAALTLAGAPVLLTASALAVGGVLANAWHGVAYTEIATMAGAGRAGAALGLEGTTLFTMGFVVPLAIPVLLGWSSWTVVWAVAAVAPLLGVPLAPGRAPRSR